MENETTMTTIKLMNQDFVRLDHYDEDTEAVKMEDKRVKILKALSD